MLTTCTHCGTEYDAEDSEYGRFVKCAVCGKGFVAGTHAADTRKTVSAACKTHESPVPLLCKKIKSSWERLSASRRKFWYVAGGFTAILIIVNLGKGDEATGSSYSGGYYSSEGSSTSTYRMSAKEAIRGALANAEARYNRNLAICELRESFYGERDGICNLCLIDAYSFDMYQIVYDRATGTLEWPRSILKNAAEALICDRMLIETYRNVKD